MRSELRGTMRKVARIRVSAVMALTALTLSVPAWAIAPDHCVSLAVPAPVILPDGSIHPAGELRMCLTRNYNPVRGIHRVYFDGMPLGMLLSRASTAEVPLDSRPTVLFYGNPKSALRLVGYTVPANGKVFSYLLWNAREAQGIQVAAVSPGASGDMATDDAEDVLLTARLE